MIEPAGVDLATWIRGVIAGLLADRGENTLGNVVWEPAWGHPLGFEGYGCGLCQTDVPCESKIPTPEDVEATSGRDSR